MFNGPRLDVDELNLYVQRLIEDVRAGRKVWRIMPHESPQARASRAMALANAMLEMLRASGASQHEQLVALGIVQSLVPLDGAPFTSA